MTVSDILRTVVALYAIIQTCDGLRCYNCKDMPDPRYCLHVTNCTDGETCFTEEAVTASGDIVFHTGCMPTLQCSSIGRRSGDITACMACCNKDYCNNAGCGITVIPRDQRGPYCFSCDITMANHQCNKVVTCAKNEICGLYNPQDYAAMPELVLQTSCMSKTQCSGLSSVTTNTGCVPTCCDADYCNDRCNASSPHLHVTASPSSTTATTTTNITSTTTTTTTTQGTSPTAVTTTTTSSTTSIATTATTTQGTSPTAVTTISTTTFPTTSTASTSSTSQGPSPTAVTSTATTTTSPTTSTVSTDTTTQGASPTAVTATTTTTTSPSTSTVSTTTTTQGAVHCPPDYNHDHVTGLCIKLFSDNNAWTAARDKCAGIGDTLVTIDTPQKMTYIYNLLAGHHTKFYWIGGQDVFNNDTFYWPNGHRFSYSNWGTTQPDHVDHGHNQQDCVGLYHNEHYRWHDATCSERHGYICEHSSTQPVSMPSTCIEINGYVDLGQGLCVHIHDNHKLATWDQARGICQSEHAVLVVLDSRVKSEVMRHYLDRHDKSLPFWIGAVDTYENDTFYWVTGQPVTFSDWYVERTGTNSQPNHVTSKSEPEDCVGAYPYPHRGDPHYWHDAKCSTLLPYICQRL